MSRLSARRSTRAPDERLSMSGYADMVNEYMTFGGNTYQGIPMTGIGKGTQIPADYAGHANAIKSSSILFAAISAHVRVGSQAMFCFQRLSNGPGETFTSAALAPLEDPWPGATTAEYIARRITDVDLAGNSYVAKRSGGRLAWLRPDWVSIAVSSPDRDDAEGYHPDAEVIGYWYTPGGDPLRRSPIYYDVTEVSHWSPFPDPERRFVGMSPVTPVLQEIGVDSKLTNYKASYLDNSATPNMAVSPKAPMTKEQAEIFMAVLNQSSKGRRNAGRTMFLNGADLTVVGADLKALDLKQVQGALESRLAAALGVPAGLVGFSEGMAANTYSNLGQARRILSDVHLSFYWASLCAASSKLVAVPASSRLWYDTKGVPFMRDDADMAASVQASEAQTIRTLTDGGFDPASVVEAIRADGDWSRLQHTGLLSVQLVPPGESGGAGGPSDPEVNSTPVDDLSVLDLALALQKLYLSVGVIITAEEAREILNRGGAGLTGPSPVAEATPAPPPA